MKSERPAEQSRVQRRGDQTTSTPAEPPRSAVPDVGPEPLGETAHGRTSRRGRGRQAVARTVGGREPEHEQAVTAEEGRQVAQTQARGMMREVSEHPLESVFTQFEQLPDSAYYIGTLGSILASIGLYLTGNRWTAIFVGLWAPSILAMAMFLKMLHPSREVRGH